MADTAFHKDEVIDSLIVVTTWLVSPQLIPSKMQDHSSNILWTGSLGFAQSPTPAPIFDLVRKWLSEETTLPMYLSSHACAGLGPLREQVTVPHEVGAGRDNSAALDLAQLLGV